ncbi:MAG: tRNA (guanosine(46)-N7)-methyltransferase TrmB [Hyphomonadaceae bacterium]|nr:tRNA (guanosine(46)-N7)-methyltransferase TrmB [Hyphomonadaceae bacterium]
MTQDENRYSLRTFGRRAGRPLSTRQQSLVENLLPKINLPLESERVLDLAALFPAKREIWLEIGFGGGEHLAGQAARNPDVGFIGCEPFIDGVAKMLTAIEEDDLVNIRLHDGDAREVIEALPDASVSRVFILFPDPWPKARHHKRRLVQPVFLEALSRVLKPCGQLRFVTDVRSYADHALEICLANPKYIWSAMRADDWRQPPADHLTTRYESKRLGDISPVWFDFIFDP